MEKNTEEALKRRLSLFRNYKDVFSSEAGEQVLKDLSDSYYIHNSMVKSGEVIDTDLLAFREGQRSVILQIIKTLDFNEDEYKSYFEENNDYSLN